MPNRRERRRQIRDARRARQFVSLLASTDDDIQELRERSPPATPIEQVRTLSEEQVIATDSISQYDANAQPSWGNVAWGQGTWGGPNG